MVATMTRSAVAALLDADAGLDGWTVYAEPPEQLTGARCVILAPQSPYIDLDTFGTERLHLTVHIAVVRSHGPAMDTLDAGIAAVRSVLRGIDSCELESVAGVGLLQDIGGPEYVVAAQEMSVERANE